MTGPDGGAPLQAGEAVGGLAGGRAGVGDRCAPSAVRRGDPRPGTASPVPRWLLVEQPGGWGVDALRESGLDPAVGAALEARARPVGARVLLIRRPGRQVPAGPRRWAVVDSRAGSERVGWGDWDHPDQLLDIPLDRPVGTPGGPLYLVCAHGRHDACCAIRGNLVVLPHGLFYAHVEPAGATDLAAAYERGEVDLGLLRGRSAFAAPAQAAQHYARLALGETGLEALRPLGLARLDGDRWRVRLAAAGGDLLVTVRSGVGPPVRLTCSSRTAQHPRRWELLALHPAPRP